MREYIKHRQKEMEHLKEESTKKKKQLTYNEIKKIIDSGSEIKSNENKSIETKPTPKKRTNKKNTLRKYNFDLV